MLAGPGNAMRKGAQAGLLLVLVVVVVVVVVGW